jgi:hypothetical protein
MNTQVYLSLVYLFLIQKFQKHGDALHRNSNPALIALDFNYPAYLFGFRKYANDITMFCLCTFLFSTSDFERADRIYWTWYKIKLMGVTRFSFR